MVINLDTVKQVVKAAVEPLRARARGMVRRAVLMALDNSAGLARVQVELTKDELADGVELLSWPGISIRPEGCEAIVLSIGGNPSNMIAIPSQRGKRLTGDNLAAGEVALHIGNADHVVRLKNDKSVVLQSGTDGATVTLKPNGDIVLTTSAAGKILLGSEGATRAVAYADEITTAFDFLQNDIISHKHGPGSYAVICGAPGAVVPVTPLTQSGTILEPLYGFNTPGSDHIFGDT